MLCIQHLMYFFKTLVQFLIGYANTETAEVEVMILMNTDNYYIES